MVSERDKGRQSRQVRSAVVRLHRWVGLFSFIVLLGIVVTGVVLNHGVDLDLDERRVTSSGVLRLYGMEPGGTPVGYEVAGKRVVEWDETIFFEGRLLDFKGELVGVAPLTGEIAAVCREAVYLLDEEGTLLESVSSALLPAAPIEAVARLDDGALVLRAEGSGWVLQPGIGVEPWSGVDAEWMVGGAVGDAEREGLLESLRGEGLPLSRVILDFHSGRIFGPIGVLVYDAAAIAVLLLSATGLWLAIRNFYRSGRGRGRSSSSEGNRWEN